MHDFRIYFSIFSPPHEDRSRTIPVSGIALKGGYAIIVEGDSSVQIVDVRDPDQLKIAIDPIWSDAESGLFF